MKRGRKMVQLELPRRGGRRTGAGRPKVKGVVLHRRRPEHKRRFPLHITLRIRREVGSLRTDKRWRQIQRALFHGAERFGMRLVEFSIQDTHVHLIVEAADKRALSRGMQGLAIRLARAVNRVAGRRGKVFADRYFARPLRTLAEVRNAVRYVHRNLQKHRGAHPWYVDPYSSMSGRASWYVDERGRGAWVTAAPGEWLLRRATAPPGSVSDQRC